MPVFGLGQTWLELMISDGVWAAMGIIPLVITILVMRSLRPGLLRALVSLPLGLVTGALVYAALRSIVGEPFSNVTAGTTLIFAGFGGAAAWMAGIGSFSSYSHEHDGFAHAPTGISPLMAAGKAAVKRVPDIIRYVIPLVQPLLLALGVVVVVLVIFVILGTIAPIHAVQTNTASASAVTPAGDINLPGDIAMNKTVFFIGVVVFVLGNIAVLGLLLSWIMSLVNREVTDAKKAPNAPLKSEPPLFRLVDFFVTWVNDIIDGARHSVMR